MLREEREKEPKLGRNEGNLVSFMVLDNNFKNRTPIKLILKFHVMLLLQYIV